MSNVRRSVWTVLLFVGCSGGKDATDTGDTTGDTSGDPAAAAPELDPLLADSHTRVPVTFMSTGHLTVVVDTPVGPRRFLVDSGASTTVLAEPLAAALGLAGPPGQLVNAQGLSVGDIEIEAPIVTLDLEGTNRQFVAAGDPAIDGILGAPFLVDTDAVLSYPGSALYLSEDGAPGPLAGRIATTLEADGYDTVAAEVNLVRFVELENTTIDGSARLTTIVDTGAGGTLVELEAAIRLGLSLEDAPGGAATIGGAVDTYVTTVDTLSLGSHALTDRTLLVVDLGDINGQLVANGLDPIEVLVGADVLGQQDAVLDYVGARLFLQPE